MGRPFNPSLATKIDIVEQEFDKLNTVESIFDNDLGGGTWPLSADGVSDKRGLATVSRSHDQQID